MTLMLPADGGIAEPWLGVLIIAAGLLWFAAAGIQAQIREYTGETDGGRNAFDSFKRLSILMLDKPSRRFVVTRALLMCSAFLGLAGAVPGASPPDAWITAPKSSVLMWLH